jgi:ethanolamine transporter
MNPKSKVISMSFLVCAGYSLGDFIAFNVNFQPNLLIAIFVGQIVGGIVGIGFAKIFAVPQVLKMQEEDELEVAVNA